MEGAVCENDYLMILQPSPPEACNGLHEGDLVADRDKGEESVPKKKKKKKKKKKAASAAVENGLEGEVSSGAAIDTSESNQNGQDNPGT